MSPRGVPASRVKPVPPMSRRLGTEEACAASGLGRRTLYRLAQDGLLTRWKVAGRTFWSVDELDALAKPAGRPW